jgi:hypothetical protein
MADISTLPSGTIDLTDDERARAALLNERLLELTGAAGKLAFERSEVVTRLAQIDHYIADVTTRRVQTLKIVSDEAMKIAQERGIDVTKEMWIYDVSVPSYTRKS